MDLSLQFQVAVKSFWIGVFQLQVLKRNNSAFILEVLTIGRKDDWKSERSLLGMVIIPRAEKPRYNGLIQFRLLYLNFTMREPKHNFRVVQGGRT